MSSFNNNSSPSQSSKPLTVDNNNNNVSRRKYSLSEAFNSFNNSISTSPFDFGGRSYISMSQRPNFYLNSPTVYSGPEVHEQTANLANIGVTDDDNKKEIKDGFDSEDYEEDRNIDDYISSSPPIPIKGSETAFNKSYNSAVGDQLLTTTSSTTPLIIKPSGKYTEGEDQIGNPSLFTRDLETGIIDFHPPGKETVQTSSSFVHQYLLKTINYIPAVFLGSLLNILDGLSYGMIMFPISETIFSSLAPVGLSMFYMSTIVSQLVYSLGGSAFKSGIGSEMIEVTPFFHSMALSIMNEMNGSGQDAIVSTTIVSYAISSIVTGLVFFLLGRLRLGTLVGFFPRHILVGCIGGVGYFLIATGIEVSSRLEGGLEYNLDTFKYLFYNYITLLEWTIPLGLTIVLIFLQHKYHNPLLVPLFFIAVFVLFHLLVLAVPNWNLESARQLGWIFPSVEDDQPWYKFYELYRFQLVDWWSILRQVPTMFALTFFGILHVPINVPALAVTVGMDQFDVDRELVAHGYSNVLSGLVGSVQNYLVYTNSVLFIRAGADDRLAGILLAIGTGAIMVTGPVLIGYIPVCVVGSLIYLLGYELLKESLYDTRGRLRKIEYSTIVIIIVTMGAYDFVFGIFVGILLACLSFVVEAARRPVVKGMYTGAVARSTVLRHPKQQEFLKDVGDQICIIKLQGTLFFGSIGGVEKVIRARFENDRFSEHPIKFLILDMKGVDSIDFSAAEGFRRILNLLNEFKTELIISSVIEDDDIIKALRDAGLWDNNRDVKLFGTLNYALEWCENSFLKTYKSVKKEKKININTSNNASIRHKSISPPNTKSIMSQTFDFGTPRSKHVYNAAARTVNDEQRIQNRYYTNSDSSFKKQPLPLIMITFSGLSDKDEEFWSNITPFFVKEKIPENFEFYNSSKDRPAFFIVESGLIRSIVKFESDLNEIHSSILPMTAFGNLYEASQHRNITYVTASDSVIWKLSESKISELLKTPNGESLFKELLKVEAKLIRERFDTMTANLVISA